MKKVADRIVALRKGLKMTQAEFAAHIDHSRGYVSQVESSVKVPGRRFMTKIELLERGLFATKLSEQRATYSSATTHSNVDPKRLELRKIPVYSFVQAGRATDFESFPESWEDEVGYLGGDPKAFGLRIVGDSMEPKYSPGDIVVVSPSHPASNGDKVVAKIRNQGVLFKVMHHSGDMKIIKLTSYNPVYPEIQIPREELHWIYPVKMVMKI